MEQPIESIHLASTHQVRDTRIFQKECRTLVAAGYRVTLIVPHEHDDLIDGVRIRAVPVPSSGKVRLTRTIWDVYKAALKESPDAIYHVHDAELILVMFLLKLQGRRVVYDAHEDTPLQVLSFHWIPRWARKPVSVVMRYLEAAAGHWLDGIITAEPSVAERFAGGPIITVRNFPLKHELVSEQPTPYAERPAHIVYVGGLSEHRGVLEIIEAVHRLPESLQARLRLGGVFFPRTLQQVVARQAGWSRVDYLGWLGRPEVARELAQARVGIVVLHPTEKYLGSYPTKLFEYMSAGLPVVASNFPGWRPFVEEAQCGLLVDPLDVQGIADAIRWLLEHPEEAEAMGQRGRRAVEEWWNWEAEGQKLVAFYQNLARL